MFFGIIKLRFGHESHRKRNYFFPSVNRRGQPEYNKGVYHWQFATVPLKLYMIYIYIHININDDI